MYSIFFSICISTYLNLGYLCSIGEYENQKVKNTFTMGMSFEAFGTSGSIRLQSTQIYKTLTVENWLLMRSNNIFFSSRLSSKFCLNESLKHFVLTKIWNTCHKICLIPVCLSVCRPSSKVAGTSKELNEKINDHIFFPQKSRKIFQI